MESIVKYYMRVTGPCTPCNSGPNQEIYSFEDLKNFVACYSASMPYTVELERVVYVVNTDATVNAGRSTLGQSYSSINGHPIINQQTTDYLRFFVCDRLIHAIDIRNFLNEQYRSTINFDATNENRAVMLDNVQTQIQMDNAKLHTNIWKKTPQPSFVRWHYLTGKDIFVNRNLKKIYGYGKGKTPVALVQLFNKKLEHTK